MLFRLNARERWNTASLNRKFCKSECMKVPRVHENSYAKVGKPATMLRPTTTTEEILYGAPGAHLRLESTNAASPLVLFAKLPSDVLKAIHLGVSLFSPFEARFLFAIGLKGRYCAEQ